MARKLFRRWLPDRETVRRNRFLAWFGPTLTHPRLWHVNRNGVARGLAIGVFMGLLIPLAQIPFSALLAVIMRANLPVAIASTLVTNPFTFAPLYYLAYRIGAALIGVEDASVTEASLESPAADPGNWLAFWYEKVMALGKPLVAGLIILASTMAVLVYCGVLLAWRTHVALRWRRRRKSRERGGAGR